MLFPWESNTFRKITFWRKTRLSYQFYHHFGYHFPSNLALFLDTFSVSISGSHFWRHFSIFGAIIDAQGVPLATFRTLFSAKVALKGSDFFPPDCSWSRSGRDLSPLHVARTTLHVQRRTCNVQRSIFD